MASYLDDPYGYISAQMIPYPGDLDDKEAKANAKHIATFNPTTALVLTAEIRRLRAGLEPQPIETAPKDGTPILGFMSEISCRILTFHGSNWWDDHSPQCHRPTHWRPLPLLGSAGTSGKILDNGETENPEVAK